VTASTAHRLDGSAAKARTAALLMIQYPTPQPAVAAKSRFEI